jgi:hypothetical protein
MKESSQKDGEGLFGPVLNIQPPEAKSTENLLCLPSIVNR